MKKLIILMIILLIIPVVSAIITDDLIYALELNGDTTDSSPNGFDFTNGGATSGYGAINDSFGGSNGAYRFDGNDYMFKSHESVFDFGTQDFTICIGINTTDTSTTRVAISNFESNGDQDGIQCSIDSDEIKFVISQSGGNEELKFNMGTVPKNYYLIVCSVRYSLTNQTIWLDAKQVASRTMTNRNPDSTDGWSIGSRETGGARDRYWIGTIMFAYLWNRSLTDEEILQINSTQLYTKDTTKPVLSNPICTSCNSQDQTTDTTPMFNITATDDLNTVQAVRISSTNQSYDDMNSSRNCTAGSGNIWICTIAGFDELSDGNKTVYFSTCDSEGNNDTYAQISKTILVDSTGPEVTIIYPTDGLSIESENVNLNWSGPNDGIGVGADTVWYSLNGGLNTSLKNTTSTYTDNIVNIYHMEESSGTIIDSGLLGYNSYVENSITYSQSSYNTTFGNAIEFDGTSSYVNFSVIPRMCTVQGDNFSMCAWVYVDSSLLSNADTMMSCWDKDASAQYQDGWTIQYVGNADQWKFSTWLDGSTTDVSMTNKLNDTWSHICVSRNINTTESWWLNGTLESQSSGTLRNISSTSLAFYLGARAQTDSSPDRYFGGLLDEYVFWEDKIVDSEDVIRHMSQKINIPSTYFNTSLNPVLIGDNEVRLCSNDTLGNENCTYVDFSIVQNCTFNGFGNLTKYEYDTNITINCTISSTVFVDNGDIFDMVGGESYDYTIDLLRISEFSDGLTEKSFTQNGSFILDADSRNIIDSVEINISGRLVSDYPLNIIFYVYGWVLNLKGKLFDDVLANQLVLCTSVTESSTCNITFPTSSTQNFYFNISLGNKINLSDVSLNISFDLYGFDIDVGNDFDYAETFNNSNYVNYTLTNLNLPHPTFDDFEESGYSEDEWEITESCIGGTCDSGIYTGGDGYYNLYNKYEVVHYGGCPGDTSRQIYMEDTNLNMQNRSYLRISATSSYKCNNGGEGSGTSEFRVSLSDSTKTLTMFSDLLTCGISTTSWQGNITLRKKSSTEWVVYVNDTLEDTVSVIPLNSSKRWAIRIGAYTTNNYCNLNYNTYHLEVSNVSVYDIEVSGLRLNLSLGNYTGNGTFTTNTLFDAPSNIATLKVSVDQELPIGTSSTLEVSNDGGSTWEIVTEGHIHKFSSSGNMLRGRTNCTTIDNTKTCDIRSITYQIIPGASRNLTIDIGGEGNIDCNISTLLNSTNSPQYCVPSTESLENYVDENCRNHSSCLITNTITSESGGIVNIRNSNITYKINPLVLNLSLFQGRNLTSVNITTLQGNLTVKDLKYDFKGRHNLSFGFNVTNYVLQVFYSPFKVDIIPLHIDEWDISPNVYSYTQNNVPPFGNGDGDGNPFYNVTKNVWDHSVDIYVGYNESVNTCQTTWFIGKNDTSGSFITRTLNSSQQLIFDNMTTIDLRHNITSYTNLSCSAYNSTLIFPYFCWNSICHDCVKSHRWDECDITN